MRLLIILLFFLVNTSSLCQTLQLISPNGGETWQGGSTHQISWNYSNVEFIKIEYSLNNGLNWILIQNNFQTSYQSMYWQVPSVGSNQCKVRVTSTTLYTQDESNFTFTIPEPTISITFPSSEDTLYSGNAGVVNWDSQGIRTVQFDYSTNGGGSWISLGTTSGANRYFTYTIPYTNGNVELRAKNAENPQNYSQVNGGVVIVNPSTSSNVKYKGGSGDGYASRSNAPATLSFNEPNVISQFSPTQLFQINWISNNVDKIDLQYSVDGGINWVTISSAVLALGGVYNWYIPNVPSNSVRLKIQSTDNPNLFDELDWQFGITSAYVDLIYPQGGEEFRMMNTQYVEWDYSSVSQVKLEYSLNAGQTWFNIGNFPASYKYANWVIPSGLTSEGLIRISDASNVSINSVNNDVFSILSNESLTSTKYKGGANDGYSMKNNISDSIAVVSPNGGEYLLAAHYFQIKWVHSNIENVAIEYSIDDGQTWVVIAASFPAPNLQYNWLVPSINSFTCRVRVRDNSRNISDVSDGNFTISTSEIMVIYPNGGEVFKTSQGSFIEWQSVNINTVKCEYSIDNGITWVLIGTRSAQDKYCYWNLPSTASSQIRVRVSDNSNSLYSDESNSVFISEMIETANNGKFKGGVNDGYSAYNYRDEYIQVFLPNGNEVWGNGNTHLIKWKTLNCFENLVLEYSIDNEQTWQLIATNVPYDQNQYEWSILSEPSNICKVRITSISGILLDKSDDFFTIANTSGIITGQLAQNSYCSLNSSLLSFNTTTLFNDDNYFIAQLSDSIGGYENAVINLGQIQSNLPGLIPIVFPVRYYDSDLYTIRVISTSPPSIGTINGSTFEIKGLPYLLLEDTLKFCDGDVLNLAPEGFFDNIFWYNELGQSISTISSEGNYTCVVSNECSSLTDSVLVVQQHLPEFYLPDTVFTCLNQSVRVGVLPNDNYSYNWSNGSTNDSTSLYFPGLYNLEVSNVCGVLSQGFVVDYFNLYDLDLGADIILCDEQEVEISGNLDGASYLWSNGSSESSIFVSEPGYYSLTVIDQCGVHSDQIQLIDASVDIFTQGEFEICAGEINVISAFGANSYTWNNQNSGNSLSLSLFEDTTINLKGTNYYGCQDSLLLLIKVNSQSFLILNDTILEGETYNFNGEFITNSGLYIDTLVSAFGCDSIVQLELVVLPALTCDVVSSSNFVCLSNDITLNIDTNLPVDSLLWFNGGTNQSLTISPLESNFFTVVAYLSTQTCTDSIWINVFDNVQPDVEISLVQNDPNYADLLCLDTISTLYAVPLNGTSISSYAWSIGSDLLNINNSSIVLMPSQDISQVILQIGSDNLCQTTNLASDTVQVQFGTFGLYFIDVDNDGFGDINNFVESCVQPFGYVLDSTDCNDEDSSLYPMSNCNDNNICTINDIIQSNCTCIGTFADTDNDGTCDAYDLCQGAEPGTACDDGDACTVNDIIEDNCTCVGTFADTDNDGTCDANDLCQGAEPGTTCDDGDACTENDVIQDNCTCTGELIDANNDSICDLNSILGCTDINACNFNPEANTEDGSCVLPQPETCNGLDDNCNGQIDEGFSAAAINAVSATTALYPVCSGNSIRTANLNNGANSAVIEGSGNDLWYSFTAQFNTFRAGLSAASGDNEVRLYTMAPGGCLELIETEHEITSGNQTLLSDQLTVGQTYYVAVHNISGAINPSAKICFNHLNASTCDHYYSNNTGIYTSVCNSFKAQYRANALAYTFDILSATQNNVNQNITPWSYTTTSASTVVARLGTLLPANQGTSPMVYTLKVPVLYSLFDAAGNFENLFAQATTTCAVTLNAESTIALRSSDRCPITKSLTSTIAPDRTVCGAMRYDWEFTEVLPNPGTAQVVQGGAYASAFFLSNVPGITAGKTYGVRVRAVHSSGNVGQWGSTQCLRVGAAGMMNHPGSADADPPRLSLRAGGERDALYAIYPNPTSTGSFVLQYNIQETGDEGTGDEARRELVMMDITGKVVFKTNVVLNGNIAEIHFGDLETGLYLVDFGGERSRVQVMK